MATSESDEISLNVSELTSGLQRKVFGDLATSSTCSIFRIPDLLIRQSRHAYYPEQFSFGPFHHHNAALKHTEKIKLKYMSDLLTRCQSRSTVGSIDAASLLTDLTTAITDIREEARHCYAEQINDYVTDDQFVELLVLDGCFIVELFRKMMYESLRESGDPLFSTTIRVSFLFHDLILLENQLPWKVLDTLFGMTKTSVDEVSLAELAIEFCTLVFSITPQWDDPVDPNQHRHKHFLDLLRNSFFLSDTKILKSDDPMEHIPSAAILEESGIKIALGASSSILDVLYHESDRVLEIPPLWINETTETVFRNLICLEQLCPDYDPVFTCYALLMGNLINTANDMELLCRSAIVVNWLDTHSADFFNKLFIGSFLNGRYYTKLCEDITKHCWRVWPRSRMVLHRHYFHKPWAFISLSAAAFFVICTFLQTFYTVHAHPWARILLIVMTVLFGCSFLTTLFKNLK